MENKYSNLLPMLSLVLLLIAVTSTSVAQEEVPFFERLKLQEDKEYQELLDRVKGMTDDEYKSLIKERIENTYVESTGNLSGLIIVDVTEEMNQPEPGFFAKFFSSPVLEDEIGTEKIKSALQTTSETVSELSLSQKYVTSGNHGRYFQSLEGKFNKHAAMALARESEIVELQFFDSTKQSVSSSFIGLDISTGRLIPAKEQKYYSDEFLSDGLYDDLMKRFETEERTFVEVNFHQLDGDRLETIEDYQARDKFVDDFLVKWHMYDFEVLRKRHNYVILETIKAHVEEMRRDKLVGIIRTGDSLFMGGAQR